MKLIFSTLLIGLCMLTTGIAQEDNSTDMLDKALVLNINTKLVSEANRVNWSFFVTKVTIPGKPVAIQLNGKNMKININFTPYREKNEKNVILVTQGQIFLKEVSTGEEQYTSTLKTIPIGIGEKIKFYPLGVGSGADYTIELEIELLSYADMLKRGEKTK